MPDLDEIFNQLDLCCNVYFLQQFPIDFLLGLCLGCFQAMARFLHLFQPRIKLWTWLYGMVCHRAWKQSPSGNQSFNWGKSLVSSTFLCWCWFIEPSTIHGRPVPCADMILHTMAEVGCFTVWATHCSENSSFAALLTYWLLSSHMENTDSSEKQTCKEGNHLIMPSPWIQLLDALMSSTK